MYKFMNKKTGFTMIEVIAVVVVILILVIIVTINFVNIRNKSKDTITKENMQKLYLLGNDWLQTHDDYGSFFEQDPIAKEICDSVESEKKFCHDAGEGFGMCAKLKSGVCWCADHTGLVKEIDCKTKCKQSIKSCN